MVKAPTGHQPAETTGVLTDDGRGLLFRRGEFWRPAPRGAIDCTLCYRRCRIPRQAAGWCGYRGNEGGVLALPAHGVVTSAVRQMRGYQVDPFLTYKPGALSLFLGGTSCTSGCTFCMSKDLVWRPGRVAWAYGEQRVGQDGGWYGRRAILAPAGAVALAEQWGCSQVEFGINEPLLSFEWTIDTARAAKRAGLDVAIETNGFSLPQVVRSIAPHTDAIDLGIKGSGDPAFYEKWMKAPGAMEAVKTSAREWRRAGTVHVIVGDVIAPPQMQDDAAFEEAARRLYDWIAETLGPLTPVLITPMMVPGPQEEANDTGKWGGMLLSARATADDHRRYLVRQAYAWEIARAAGLAYAHRKLDDTEIRCHACDGVLLRFRSPLLHCQPCTMPLGFCRYWSHEQHVTARRCDHCGADVPIVTLDTLERRAVGDRVREWGQEMEGRAVRRRIGIPLPMIGA